MHPTTRFFLLIFFFSVFSFLGHGFSQTPGPAAKKVKKISLLDRLLMEELPQLNLSMNVEAVYGDRKLQAYHWGEANIQLNEEESILEEIQVRTRGKYRSRNCENPPLKIKFSNKKLKARNFKKLNEFKVVYPCEAKSIYQTYVFKEYLVYKLSNVLTENGLRVQLVDLVIQDSTQVEKSRRFKAFLIEDREELISRIDAQMSDMKCMRPNHLDPHDYTLFQVFQFFIGNTDWLLPTCQNAEVVSMKNGRMLPIPYDFDFSGLVSTEYATVNPGFGIRSVKDRYFLGHQKSMEELDPILALFQQKKTALLQVIEDFEYLPKGEKKVMTRYLESFYKILEKPKKVKKIFVHPMAESMAKDY